MKEDHDCDIDRQAQCGKRDSKNSGSTYQRGRIHERERVHGDMDLRQHAFAGHAEGLRDGPPGTRGLPDKSRPLQTDGKTHQDRYGMDTGHQRGPPAESDRKSIRRLRKYHCGHRRLPEGEMVFRYLYRYLECRKPYRRLWISSLTDEAVLEGMGSLRPGSLYDRMFLAADSRNKADWVLGLNASYALCQATGTGNNSLGRVQTPVLTAISSRYRERENHIATDTFPVFISLCKNNTLLKMRCTEEFTDREAAARLYSDCKLAGHARVTAVSRQIREIEPPALYNLTELQKDANNYYGMTAGKSLEIAQRLYEKKLISYPRTAGRFLPRDVYDKLPRIMEKILNRKEFRPYVRSMGINIFDLPDKVVDEGQAAEHHAIIITDTYPEGLNREEMQLYMMIIGRMLEAFMPACRAEYTTVDAVCAARNFRCHACRIIEKDGSAYSKGKASLQEGNTAYPPSRNWKTGRRPLLPDAA